jgi:hypothetical protein
VALVRVHSAGMSYLSEKVPVPADRSRIDVADPAEVRWWSRLLGCSPEQLLDAVSRVGESAARVELLVDTWSGFGLGFREVDEPANGTRK